MEKSAETIEDIKKYANDLNSYEHRTAKVASYEIISILEFIQNTPDIHADYEEEQEISVNLKSKK